ncbi:MAG TPA: Fe-S cluster assembly protein SufD [Chloroflexota bacterium]|jgi:Fe-S cluster assembly protein SufD|nr:Fe-S cluster assembly protein SufD [Chloroflexota bacterium]
MTTTTESPAGYTRQSLDAILATTPEPQWLREWRLQAWHVFEETPWPNSRTDEEWRRTNVMGSIRFDRYRPLARPTDKALALASLPVELGVGGASAEGRGGLLALRNGEEAIAEPGSGLRDGVLFMSLGRAAQEHPELVQRYLGQQAVPLTFNKFAAMNAAFWQGGVFLYVPRFVEVALPLQALHWTDAAGIALTPRTLVVLEDGAKVTFIDQVASADGIDILANPVTELYVGRGARLRYVNLQQLGNGAANVGIQRAVVGANAQFNSLTATLGSRWHRSNVAVVLDGEGAETEMLGMTFADGSQFIDHHTFQDHVKPGAKSDLLFKGALKDRSRTVWTGMIRVHPNAQRTDAYQANRNLLLSGNSRADSIPGLEIAANEVRCTHGATAGPVDKEQVFYLMSRGLPRDAAVRLIVDGFYEPVLQRITLAPIREQLTHLISRRVEGVTV